MTLYRQSLLRRKARATTDSPLAADLYLRKRSVFELPAPHTGEIRPRNRSTRLDPHGGASAARPELNWRSVNTRSRSEKGGAGVLPHQPRCRLGGQSDKTSRRAYVFRLLQ